MSGTEEQLKKLAADLQKKISKAKPIVEQVEKGELKVLTEVQEKQVSSYARWQEELALVRKGQIPPKVVPAAPKKAAAPVEEEEEDEEVAAADDDLPAAAQPRSFASNNNRSKNSELKKKQQQQQQQAQKNQKGKGSGGKQQKNGGGGQQKTKHADPEPTMSLDPERKKLLLQLQKANKKTKNVLIDSFLNSKLDKSKLRTLTKEYDQICALRRDVLSGRIQKPSKIQNQRIGLLDQLKKEMALENEAHRLQLEREKITLLCELGLDESESDEEVVEEEEEEYYEEEEEEEDYDEEEEEEEGSEAPNSESPSLLKEEEEKEAAGVKSSSDDDKDNEPEKKETSEEDAAGEAKEAVSRGEDCEDEAEANPEEEAAAEEPKKEEPSQEEQEEEKAEEEVKEEEEVAPVEEQKEEEVEEEKIPTPPREPTPPPPPPPPPKEIDWSEVTIERNRPRIGRIDSSSPVQSPTSDSAPTAMPKVDPASVTPMEIGGSTTTGSAGSQKKKEKKGGDNNKKGGKASSSSTTNGSSPTGTLQQSVLKRVAKDYAICKKCPLSNVAFCLIDENLLNWHINVCPKDGPLAGMFIHLEMKFGELYPMEPPLVRSFVDIPHPNIGPKEQIRNVLCMEHTTDTKPAELSPMKGWTPIYSALSILQQLQTFFGAEAFADAKKALGSSHKTRLLYARGDLSRFKCEISGHTQDKPVPPLHSFNGPMEHPPQGLTTENGTICVAKGGAKSNNTRIPIGHKWVHGYTQTGVHQVKFTLTKAGEEGAFLGVSTGKYNGPAEKIGLHPQSIAIDTNSGTLGTCGIKEEYEGSVDFPLPNHSQILMTIDFPEKKVRFELLGDDNGTPKLLCESPDLIPGEVWYPAFGLQSADTAIEMECVITQPDSSDLTDWVLVNEVSNGTPLAPSSSSNGDSSEAAQCFVSFANQEEALLGCGVAVSRDKKYMPTSIFSTLDIISQEASERHTHSVWGAPIDALLPLMLDEAHAKKALPALKKIIPNMCRNPNASSFYAAPFRPEQGSLVMSLAIDGVADRYAKSSAKLRNPEASLIGYTRFLQSFAYLATDTPSVVAKAKAAFEDKTTPAGVVFALSTVLPEISWTDVVKRALNNQLRTHKDAGSDEATAMLSLQGKSTIFKHILFAAAFAHAVRGTYSSVEELKASLAETQGKPTENMSSALAGDLAIVQKNGGGTKSEITWSTFCAALQADVAVDDVL